MYLHLPSFYPAGHQWVVVGVGSICFCSRFLPDKRQFFSVPTLLPLGLWVSVKTILLMTDKVLAWGSASVNFKGA